MSLQALVILAVSYANAGCASRFYGLMAIVTRFARLMNLHSIDAVPSNTHCSMGSLEILPPASTPTEKEERRRTFWAIFLLDRYLSVSTGWPLQFRDDEIRTRLPCLDEEFQVSRDCGGNDPSGRNPDRDIGSNPLCIEAAALLGKVVSWLRTPWNEQEEHHRQREGLSLGEEMENWWREKVQIAGKEKLPFLSGIHNW